MAVQAGLYAVVLATAFAASWIRPLSARGRRRPWATAVSLLVVGVPTLAQFTVAPWLRDLERNWALIGRGQIWRLFSSLLVQDGGIVGAVFNLAALAVIGFAAERLWGSSRWTAIALTAGVGAQLWGKIVQPVGGGTLGGVRSSRLAGGARTAAWSRHPATPRTDQPAGCGGSAGTRRHPRRSSHHWRCPRACVGPRSPRAECTARLF